MRPRSDCRPVALEVRALYSIAALARVANVSTYMLRRVLRANGVELVRSGRALHVPLSEIQRRIPPLWESLWLAQQTRASARPPRMRER